MPISTGAAPSSRAPARPARARRAPPPRVDTIGQHDAHRPERGGAVDRPELRQEQLRLAQAEPEPAHAEERDSPPSAARGRARSLSPPMSSVRRMSGRPSSALRPSRRRPRTARPRRGAVAVEEEELGPHQAHALRAGLDRLRGLGHRADVGGDPDAVAVGQDRRARKRVAKSRSRRRRSSPWNARADASASAPGSR